MKRKCQLIKLLFNYIRHSFIYGVYSIIEFISGLAAVALAGISIGIVIGWIIGEHFIIGKLEIETLALISWIIDILIIMTTLFLIKILSFYNDNPDKYYIWIKIKDNYLESRDKYKVYKDAGRCYILNFEIALAKKKIEKLNQRLKTCNKSNQQRKLEDNICKLEDQLGKVKNQIITYYVLTDIISTIKNKSIDKYVDYVDNMFTIETAQIKVDKKIRDIILASDPKDLNENSKIIFEELKKDKNISFKKVFPLLQIDRSSPWDLIEIQWPYLLEKDYFEGLYSLK